MNLPNPFIDSAAAPATVAESAAGLRSDPADPAAANSNSALPGIADTAVASNMPPAPEAAAVVLTVASPPARLDAPDAAGTPATPVPAAFSSDDTQYIISQPRQIDYIDAIGLAAVHRALNLHPRDLDLDPPPLFLRKPRPAFLRALLQFAGDAR